MRKLRKTLAVFAFVIASSLAFGDTTNDWINVFGTIIAIPELGTDCTVDPLSTDVCTFNGFVVFDTFDAARSQNFDLAKKQYRN